MVVEGSKASTEPVLLEVAGGEVCILVLVVVSSVVVLS
jgi:hypothetical protein